MKLQNLMTEVETKESVEERVGFWWVRRSWKTLSRFSSFHPNVGFSRNQGKLEMIPLRRHYWNVPLEWYQVTYEWRMTPYPSGNECQFLLSSPGGASPLHACKLLTHLCGTVGSLSACANFFSTWMGCLSVCLRATKKISDSWMVGFSQLDLVQIGFLVYRMTDYPVWSFCIVSHRSLLSYIWVIKRRY